MALTSPGNVSVAGILVDGSADNEFNGVFAIEGEITSDTQVKYKPYATPVGTVTLPAAAIVGAPVSPHYLQITNVAVVSGRQVRITTASPHNRTANNVVKILNIEVTDADGHVIYFAG